MIRPDDDRDPVEILVEEFLERHRKGEEVSVVDYENRYPDLAEDIREIFPAMLAMETAKPKQVLAPQLESFDAVAKGQIRRLGDFRILRKIAQGGMGIVYEAEEVSLGRRVAIKVLAANQISDKAALERFRREAKTIARLHHTNIVSVFGAGAENDLHYFVMEYIDGKSIERLIKSGEFEKKFKDDWDWIAEVVKRIALGLRHAHEKNVLHRDVKPGNVLIDSDRKAWITDFGLAKLEENDDLTRPGDAVGTLRYMAPEQLKGHPDRRSDIYGLGLVLYEMLTAEKVYGDSGSQNLIKRISAQNFSAPSKVNPRVPRDLEMIALKATAPDPNDRYQQAVELADDLDRWQNDLPIRARPLSALETARRWAKRNPVIAALSAAVFCLMVVLTIAFGVITFAWLGADSARLDAKLSQQDADQARLDAEEQVAHAMVVLDQLSRDLAVFNPIGNNDNESQNYLFSPMGGLPISRKTEKQLDLIHDFYQTVGQTSGNRSAVRFRKLLANIRSSEIALQLRQYSQAKSILRSVAVELGKETEPELLSLRLYAGELTGYANLQSREYDEAQIAFRGQLQLIKELKLGEERSRIERGKALLGLGLVAHCRGKVNQWHDHLLQAIDEFESLVDWTRPLEHPVGAVFLSRCYLNIPPRFLSRGYDKFFLRCKTRAVSMLFKLHDQQLKNAESESDVSGLLFFYDYCDAVASLPNKLTQVQLAEEFVLPTEKLLREIISECKQVVQQNPHVPAFRFALARCQLNLALRSEADFEELSAEAAQALSQLTETYSSDAVFLTEAGNVDYRIGLYHLSSKNYSTAKPFLQTSLSKLNQSLQCSPGYPRTQVILPQVHDKLALLYEEQDDRINSEHHRNQAAVIRKTYPHPHAAAGVGLEEY